MIGLRIFLVGLTALLGWVGWRFLPAPPPVSVRAPLYLLPPSPHTGRVSLIIDDLGISSSVTREALRFPPYVGLAFSAYAPLLGTWIKRAKKKGHTTLLMIPMQSLRYPQNDPGPLGLMAKVPLRRTVSLLKRLLSRASGYEGVMNAMGGHFRSSTSLLTPLFRTFRTRNLFYLDTRVDADGNAFKNMTPFVARQEKLPFVQADMVITSPRHIEDKLRKFFQESRKRGGVLVVSASPLLLRPVRKWILHKHIAPLIASPPTK